MQRSHGGAGVVPAPESAGTAPGLESSKNGRDERPTLRTALVVVTVFMAFSLLCDGRATKTPAGPVELQDLGHPHVSQGM